MRTFYVSYGSEADEIILNGETYIRADEVGTISEKDVRERIDFLEKFVAWSQSWPRPLAEGSIFERGEDCDKELEELETLAKKLTQ